MSSNQRLFNPSEDLPGHTPDGLEAAGTAAGGGEAAPGPVGVVQDAAQFIHQFTSQYSVPPPKYERDLEAVDRDRYAVERNKELTGI